MPDQTAYIQVQTADGAFGAYLAIPATPSSVAVVVLQEIFGVNSNIRATVDRFAEAGYAAIAPDLYWRLAPGIELDPGSEAGRARAMELLPQLRHDQAIADGAAALAALRDRVPALDRSAAVGYCFGGGVAFLMATRGVVDAGIAYYGTGLDKMLGELDALDGRLLLHIAADDHVCPPPAQAAIAAAVAEKAPDRAEVLVHPGVGHAFARLGGATYDAAAAARADARTMTLLESLPG